MKNFKLGKNPIAVVGMSALMPDATNLTSYWDNIVERMVSIVDVPADRWSIEDYYDTDPFVVDKTYCKRGAFIPDIEFNPMEYGLPPNILEVTDVSQLLGLVVARDVLEDSGIFSEADYNHDRIGITLGIGGGQKLSAALTARLQYPVIDKVLKGAGVPDADRNIIIEKYKKAFVPWEENSFPGLLGNVIAGRIANRFNFGGMNSVVDAACASSLSAIKMAVNELVLGNSDMMITGGSCTDNSIFMYMSFSKTPAFTPTEFIRPFDVDSKGMMVGEGVGMIALKRLEDAERDGDRIYALIKGMGASSDGRFKSIYAPRPEGQAKALMRAYDQAGFEPKTVGLVEAHGTGTAAGDVAEFTSLKTVFAKDNDQKQYIALGSVKSQIGHLKAAAGAAGFIKAALALHHKVLPPTASVNTPNPKMAIETSPFYINAETRPWMPAADGSPRRAAVSAFGFGGTNFHFVLEEYKREAQGQFRIKHVDKVSLIDAANPQALISQCETLLKNLQNKKELARYQSFIDQTKLKDISKDSARLAFVSKDVASAISMLELALQTLKAKSSEAEWELPQGISYRKEALNVKGKVVALFPGQGSQYLRMGDALAQNFPEFQNGLAQLDSLFIADKQPRLSDRIYPIAAFTDEAKKAQDATLQQTQFAQPSIGAFSVGAFKILSNAGFKADFVAGHSFGELSALWAAGVYSEEDFYRLAKARGAAMAAPEDKNLGAGTFDSGTMMAVSGDVEKLEQALKAFPEIKIANYNSKAQVVIAGSKAAINNAQAELKAQGFKLIALSVSAAFHTPLVAHAQKPFAADIDKIKFSKPAITVYSNGSGKQHDSNPAKIKSALKEHILNSVRFKDEIENIYKDGGRVFVEFGPKNVLAKLCDNILEGKDVKTFSVNPSASKCADSQLKLLAAKLAVLGVSLQEVDPYAAPQRVYNTEKPSPLNIKISAAAYVSDKTRKAFEDTLKDGYQLSATKLVEKIVNVPAAQSASTESASTESASGNVSSGQTLPVHDINLDAFYALQNETLRVHEKYLENPVQYVESFQSLLSQLTQVMQEQPGFVLPESIERSLMMFNEQQKETLKVHETFLRQQAEVSKASLNLMNEHYSLLTGSVSAAPVMNKASVAKAAAPMQAVPVQKAPVPSVAVQKPVQAASAPVQQVQPPVQAAGLDFGKLKNLMLDVVAEKTGYPKEMLELDMDMEADLGIDSIKRVEILGAVDEAFPGLPEMNPEAMSELRTLAQIVSYMEGVAAKAGPVITANANVVTVSNTAASTDVASVMESGFDLKSLTAQMLAVVAEKTGYPSEMLELDMDMEADLGIDSIKRVEILGAIQEVYPNLPELNPEVLSELRTLQQIVDHIKELMPVASAQTKVAASAAANSVVRAAAPAIDSAALQQSMLQVVAEKTGYPKEMLELDMDMEADLGIDSIKRVEILGAIQEQHPELPEMNPEAMAELRTLAQIIDYMKAQLANFSSASVVSNSNAAPAHISQSATSVDLNALTQGMLTVVAEKTGYPKEMLELDMDMEADLGIDSIKRVEILGAVQELFPELPELNPEALAELRSLRQIVDYMKAQAGAVSSVASVAGVQKAATQSASTVTTTQAINSRGISVEKLKTLMLSVVSEKTGYPKEMLELDMDMEADLGIDSIKRVEILGAIQEQVPDLPELDAEKLSEMRTLGEIVKSMESAISNAIPSNQHNAELVSLDEYKQNKAQGVANTHAPASLKPARARVRVSVLAEPDQLIQEVPKNRACLLCDDGTELTVKLASAYQNMGWPLAVLAFKGIESKLSAKQSKDLQQIKLKSFEEAELVQALEKIESSSGKVANFVYLDSQYQASGKNGLAFSENGKLNLRHLFLLAKHLKASLNQQEANSRNAFVAVTHLDGCLGYGSSDSSTKTKFDAQTGGVFGLCKTLKQEWLNVFCRALDLAPALEADQACEFVLAENLDSNISLCEVARSEQQRSTLVPVEVFAVPAPGKTEQHHISKNSVFVVSGGAKGVTATCVIELAKQQQCKFILLGRSKLMEKEPGWAAVAKDEAALKQAAMAELKAKGEKPTPVTIQQFINPVLSNREIQNVIAAIEKAGGQARYIACDVTDQKNLKKLLKTASDELGKITGLVHGAGVLADKLIEKKTVEDFEAVYNTKIAGLASLLECIDYKKLEHLVLFSSAAGFFGNPAQADYAMANDILNKAALIVASQNPKCRVLSFNWGPWDGGMVTPQLKKLFEQRGVELISYASGAKLFSDYLGAASSENPQILVGSSMEVVEKKSLKLHPGIKIKRQLSVHNNPFLADHKIADKAVLPIVCAAAWHADSALAVYPQFSLLKLEDVRVFNGIVLDETEKKTFIQELSDPVFNEQSETLSLNSLIYSESSIDGKVKRTNHYAAKVELALKGRQAKTEPFKKFFAETLQARSADDFYKNGTLFHGEQLQLLTRVLSSSEQGMTLEAVTGDYSIQEQGQFSEKSFDHFSMDALLQAGLVWVREFKDMGSLPLKIARFEFYKKIDRSKPYLVSLQVKEQNSNKMSCDLICHDETGVVYAKMLGAEVTMSKQLDKKFAS